VCGSKNYSPTEKEFPAGGSFPLLVHAVLRKRQEKGKFASHFLLMVKMANIMFLLLLYLLIYIFPSASVTAFPLLRHWELLHNAVVPFRAQLFPLTAISANWQHQNSYLLLSR